MKEKIAEFELTGKEVADAISKYISQTRLTDSHFWDSTMLNVRAEPGNVFTFVISFYLSDEGRKERERVLAERRKLELKLVQQATKGAA